MTSQPHLTVINRSETHDLANEVSDRYGRLALARAAGEAAAAEKSGDRETHDLWTSVVSYMRQSMDKDNFATA